MYAARTLEKNSPSALHSVLASDVRKFLCFHKQTDFSRTIPSPLWGDYCDTPRTLVITVTLCLSLCGSKAGAGRHLAAAGVSAAISDLCICDPVTQSFSVKLIVTRD